MQNPTTYTPEMLVHVARTLADLMASGAKLAAIPTGRYLVLFHGSTLRASQDGTLSLTGDEIAHFSSRTEAEFIARRFSETVRRNGADASAVSVGGVEDVLRQRLAMHGQIAEGVLKNIAQADEVAA